MNSKREFEIPFVGLKPGIHEFEYKITDKFFEAYTQQDFHNCKAAVKLGLDKKAGFMLLKFEVGGTIEVVCDRCGNDLPLELWDEFNIVVKLVEDPELMNTQEEDPDVYYISKGESHLDVKTWMFEFINLSMPMQKTCGFENMDGPHCSIAARDILKTLRPGEGKEENPIWKGLEKFRGLES